MATLVPQLDAQRKDAMPAALGHYEILREIASGGMATVYLGRKRGIDGFEREVAIKCCHPHLRRDPAFVTMFLDEARLAAKIHHPNVVAMLDIGDDDALYFAMQYVQGSNLAEWIKFTSALGQRIGEELLLRVMLDGLSGLHAAHELRDDSGKLLNLIHRDVTPHNLLIGIDGVTRIADFGIAKAETRATRTRTGQVKGKTGYMPPEQILGEPMDRRADIYAAGVVLWEALTGKRLFDADSDAAIINQVLNARVAAPSTVSNASTSLDAIVARALQFNPDDRYATALEFAQALEQAGIAMAPPQTVGEAIGAWVGVQDSSAAVSEAIETRPAAIQSVSSVDVRIASVAQTGPLPVPAMTRRTYLIAAGLVMATIFAWWLWTVWSPTSANEAQVPQLLPPPATPALNTPINPPARVQVESKPEPNADTALPPRPVGAEVHRSKPAIAAVSRPRVDATSRSNIATPSTPVAAEPRVTPVPTVAAATPSAALPPMQAKAKPSEFRPPDL